jgi:iron complex transport system substrate-binding protein
MTAKNVALLRTGQRTISPEIILILIVITTLTLAAGCLSAKDTTGEEILHQNTAGKNSTVTITDSAGKTLTLPHHPKRIVSLNKAATEVLINIGAADQIVGVSDSIYEDPILRKYLPANVRKVGVYTSPDIEAILAVRPEVVITLNYAKPKNIDKMLAANITTVHLSSYKPDEISGDIRTLGILTGREADAGRFAQFIDRYVSLVESRIQNVSDSDKQRIYFEFSDYSAVGPGAGGDHMITTLKGKNIAAGLPGESVQISREWLLEVNPDVMFKHVSPKKGTLKETYLTVFNRSGFSEMQVIRNKRVYILSTEITSTPRSITGLLYMAKALYPDRFSDVDPEEVLHEYAQEFLPGSDEIDAFYPPLPCSSERILMNSTITP